MQAVTEGRVSRLLVNFPPRCGKSLVASVCWPAWVWARSQGTYLSGPGVQFLTGSYNHDLSLRLSNLSRRLILSSWYQERWGKRVVLRDDQNTKSAFDTVAGGSRIATSVGGSLLGIGGAVISVDDPHNTEGVESEAERNSVTEWWKELSTTRLNDPKRSAVVVIMQRLHQEDVSGLILGSKEAGEWTHLCLPMRYEKRRHCGTVLGGKKWQDPRRKDGELLWPERFGEKEVATLEAGLGSYMASGRLQQSPSPSGGGLFKRDWWQPWTDEEGKKIGAKPGHLPALSFVLGVIDTAYTAKEENDPCAMVVLGIWRNAIGNPQVVLCNAWEEWLEFNPLVEKTAETCERFGVDRLLIEAKASGISVAQEINRRFARKSFGLDLIDPGKGDKLSRAYAITSILEEGQVWAPANDDGTFRRWAEKVIDQMGKFPKDKHDDLTDAVVHGLKYLRDTGMLLRVDEHRRAEQEEATYKPPLQPLYPV